MNPLQRYDELRAIPRLHMLCGVCLLISGLIAGCKSPPEQRRPKNYLANSGDLNHAMAGARTFSFHPGARIIRPYPGRSQQTLQHAAESAIAASLESRGYVLDSEGNGDRLVAYAIGVTGEMRDSKLMKLFGIMPGVDIDAEQIRGGMVLVILNPHTRLVEWRASASANASNPAPSAAGDQQQIRAAADSLLKNLRPR